MTHHPPSFSHMFEREFMANQSSIILQKVHREAKQSKITIGLSKSLADEGNKLNFSGNPDSLELNNMDSTRILGSDPTDANQDHKRRCFEKLVVRREQMFTQQHVEDVNCALEAEVIDDTALIETTAAITGFKNRYGKHPVSTVVLRNPKQDNGKNKGVKKLQERCSMKCPNDKKLNSATEKKIPEAKGQNGYNKMPDKVKYDYQRKDIKNPKIFGETMQESDVNLKVSVGTEKELTKKLVETETVNEKNNEPEDQNVHENTTVGSKKVAYSRGKLEALRSVDEEGQTSKWTEVYSGFAPFVAREYAGLVVDANNNRVTQRYTRVLNCGSSRGANAILNAPPVLPLCSPSNYM